ncbi:Regulator of RpoS [Vibrio stylophorae]|uniref:Regulator of RpoS n=1 Tax=Vibrio stylophorae TaxID=659351 RepID=A0ABM8ZWZ7_9VIBR|nr:SpoIIE family protein phosphatase [Vibrio stylophorae]CAH0535172.1 Regulator of RpoS [Vibrio stylophorae]
MTPAQVLVVDDNKSIQMAYAMVLQKRGYSVVTANDGCEALERLQEHPQIQVVLSDWLMPRMDGIALCQRIKNNALGRYIFFILVSGQDDKDSIVMGIDAGADDFIVKQSHYDEMAARVRAAFRTVALHNDVVEKQKALEKAKKIIEADLRLASEVHQSLLPRNNRFPGVGLSYVFQPSYHIGGDMLGYFPLSKHQSAIYLLDVSGHGVASALMSFSVQQMLSSGIDDILKDPDSGRVTPPDEVLSYINQRFSERALSHYFTMIYGVFDQRTGQFSYASGGHPPFVWFHASSGTVELVEQRSYVVGMFDFAQYQMETIELQLGDRLWFYSDGLTEVMKMHQAFGEERLRDAALAFSKLSMQAQAQSIVDEVKRWQGHEHFEDDVTILGMEWTGIEQGEKQCNIESNSEANVPSYS